MVGSGGRFLTLTAFQFTYGLSHAMQTLHGGGSVRIVELPFTFRDRTAGQSKMRASIAFEGVRMVARLRRDGWQPQRVASAARTGA